MPHPHPTRPYFNFGCLFALVCPIIVISLAVLYPKPDPFARIPIQVDPINPLLGQWNVSQKCSPPALPRQVKFLATGKWVSAVDPTIQGRYLLRDPKHVDIVFHSTSTLFEISVSTYAINLNHGTEHYQLDR